MILILDRCLKRSHLVQELFERWQLGWQGALAASDVEELCAECADLCQLCKQTWQSLWHRLSELPVVEIESIGLVFQEIVDRSLEVATAVNKWADRVQKKQNAELATGQLPRRIGEVEEVKREIAEKWPFVDYAMVAESRAAFLRGDYQTAEELLHDLQGHCAAADK